MLRHLQLATQEDEVVLLRYVGTSNALADDPSHVRIAGDQPTHRQRTTGRATHACPQDETVAERVAACDAVIEAQRRVFRGRASAQTDQRRKKKSDDRTQEFSP